jgi:hypothetical protein
MFAREKQGKAPYDWAAGLCECPCGPCGAKALFERLTRAALANRPEAWDARGLAAIMLGPATPTPSDGTPNQAKG